MACRGGADDHYHRRSAVGARAAFNIASYTLLPFRRVAMRRDEMDGRQDLGTGPLSTIGNVLWLVLAGSWLGLGHVITAIGLAITIIPFAWAHLKLATPATSAGVYPF